MRNVREPIRLKCEAKLSHEQIAGALAPRLASYGGRIKPDFAHLHVQLKRSNVTLVLALEYIEGVPALIGVPPLMNGGTA